MARRIRRPSVVGGAVVALVAACLVVGPATIAPAPTGAITPPTGAKKILVLPVEFPSCGGCTVAPGNPTYCPDAKLACPSGPYLFGTPRHSPSEWESILNSTVSPFWSTTTYGKTTLSFTVVADPNTGDGWFPAPRSVQYYNGGNWAVDPKTDSVPYAPDITSSIIDTLCSNPIVALALNCGTGPTNFPHDYDGLVIVNNWQGFGGQTYDNGAPYPFDPSTVGSWNVSATVTNEAWGDSTFPATVEHELGHQFGLMAHYGDCSHYPPPFLGGTGYTTLDCLGEWDVMSYTYCSGTPYVPTSEVCKPTSQLSGYSRFAGGWLTPADTVGYDLIAGGPFTTTVSLGPLEIAPAPGRPDLLRLSLMPLDWPRKLEYDVECREKVNGEGAIPDTGVIVTSVHEDSVSDLLYPAPASHVVRSLTPFDHVKTAMHPGDTYTDNTLGLSIRFDGYVADDHISPAKRCNVTVSNLEPLPDHGFFGMAPGPLLDAGLGSASGLAPDLGLDVGELPAVNGPAGPLPVDPPWSGHDNLLLERVHNFDTADVNSASGTIAPSDKFTDLCGSAPSGVPVSFGTVAAGSDATGEAHWTAPTAKGALVLSGFAQSGDGRTTDAQSGFAFQFHATPGVTMTTTMKVGVSSACSKPEQFIVAPATTPSGWTVSVDSPARTIKPGTTATFRVNVTAPVGVAPGYEGDLPLLVLHSMDLMGAMPAKAAMSCRTRGLEPCQGDHLWPIGTMHVLARVVGPPATAGLSCPATATQGVAFDTATSVDVAGGNVLAEFALRSGSARSEAATFGPADGRWHASYTPSSRGKIRVTARWGGDTAHAPVQTASCVVTVGGP